MKYNKIKVKKSKRIKGSKYRKVNYSKIKQKNWDIMPIYYVKNYINKSTKIIFILSLLFLICLINKSNSFFFLKSEKNIINGNIRNDIIDVNINKQFEKMKEKYCIDSFLKPYLDKVNLLSHLYHKKIEYFKKNKNNIHICMSFNDRYVYQILVSITTVLINCDKNNTFITYYILCNPDVKNSTLSILKSLIYKYPSNLEIIFYDMGSNFIDRNDARLSQSAYYRLLTPVLLDVDKIIYLDGDTIILNDLNEMYELPLNDNYILGILDYVRDGIDFLGIKSEKYINSGVILLDLKKIRNDNKIYQLINMTKTEKSFDGHDQTIINYVFYPKIGILPSKFAIWNFSDKKDIQIYLSLIRTKIDINELEESFLNPTIIHNVLCWPKIFFPSTRYSEDLTTCRERGNCFCEKYHNLWYYYANKTDYYDNITHFFK